MIPFFTMSREKHLLENVFLRILLVVFRGLGSVAMLLPPRAWGVPAGFLASTLLTAVLGFFLAGIMAGALKIPVLSFLGATWIGKTARAMLLAYGGYQVFGKWLGL